MAGSGCRFLDSAAHETAQLGCCQHTRTVICDRTSSRKSFHKRLYHAERITTSSGLHVVSQVSFKKAARTCVNSPPEHGSNADSSLDVADIAMMAGLRKAGEGGPRIMLMTPPAWQQSSKYS